MKFSKPAALLGAASMLVFGGHAHSQDPASLTLGGINLNVGYNRSRFSLFDKPRPNGALSYLETSRGYNKSQIYVALRRSY